MNRKFLAIAIIAVSLAIIAAIVYFTFFYNYGPPPEEPQTNAPAQNLPASGDTTSGTPTSVVTASKPAKVKAEMNEEDLKKIAGSFTERFGSFSNQSNFANIEDLFIFMTASMKEWAEKYINNSSRTGDRSIYYGITTKAVSEEVKSFDADAGTAEILVKAQRKEATGTMSNFRFFYQDIIITFRKEGSWKVDSAVWQTN